MKNLAYTYFKIYYIKNYVSWFNYRSTLTYYSQSILDEAHFFFAYLSFICFLTYGVPMSIFW